MTVQNGQDLETRAFLHGGTVFAHVPRAWTDCGSSLTESVGGSNSLGIPDLEGADDVALWAIRAIDTPGLGTWAGCSRT